MRRTLPALILSVMLLTLLGTSVFFRASAQDSSQQKLSDRDRAHVEEMLSTLHDAVKKDYYDPTFHGIDMDARYQKYQAVVKNAPTLGDAFRGVAAYLAGLRDSHTFFVPPMISYRFDYGFRMEMIGDRGFVTEVRPGSDAASKIHPGDEILKLGAFTVTRGDFEDIEYFLNTLSPQGVLQLQVRDPHGAARTELVQTKFLTGKRVIDVTHYGSSDLWQLIFKQEAAIHLLRMRWVEIGDTFIWKIPAFNMTPDEINDFMGKARKHSALVVDLRGNPGGLIDSLTYLAGCFFDHEVTIANPIGRKHERPMVAKSHGKTFTGKLLVLVDSGSASASEIFARTMQINHRAIVVGDLSAGAVMESKVYPFQIGVIGGNDLIVFYDASITHDDLIMPDGKSLENVGVAPDVLILPSATDLAAGRDPALAQAAQLAGAKVDPAAAGKFFPFEWAPLN